MTGSPESCQTVPQPALSNSASEWGGYSSRSNETVGPGHQVWWSSTNPIVLFCLIFLIVWFCKKKENVFGTLSNTPVTYLYIVNMYFNLLMSYNKYDQCSWWAGVSNCTRAETRSHLRKKDKILFFFLIYISITNIIAWQTCIGIGVCLAKCFLTLFLMRLSRELCLLLGSNWTPFACQAKWLHYEAIFTDERCLETVFSVYPAVDLPLCYLHRSHSLCSTE